MNQKTKPLTDAQRQVRYRNRYQRFDFCAQKPIAQAITEFQKTYDCTVTRAIESLIYTGYQSLIKQGKI
jgi:hypothetical protein